eukprot:TRINITY_DN14981_c0_g5_i1.p1 TRINITY_DN14981_c0_g5~~TRINITY_DN14981_c0_g5_i1.p1  ORF type:complete len:515 (+),score=73.00 TRINITY_DN14981_c0_g5_i1:31-1575(+)
MTMAMVAAQPLCPALPPDYAADQAALTQAYTEFSALLSRIHSNLATDMHRLLSERRTLDAEREAVQNDRQLAKDLLAATKEITAVRAESKTGEHNNRYSKTSSTGCPASRETTESSFLISAVNADECESPAQNSMVDRGAPEPTTSANQISRRSRSPVPLVPAISEEVAADKAVSQDAEGRHHVKEPAARESVGNSEQNEGAAAAGESVRNTEHNKKKRRSKGKGTASESTRGSDSTRASDDATASERKESNDIKCTGEGKGELGFKVLSQDGTRFMLTSEDMCMDDIGVIYANFMAWYAPEPGYHEINVKYPGVELINRNPNVFYVRDFLTKDECARLIKKGRKNLQPSQTAKSAHLRSSKSAVATQREVPTVVSKIRSLVGCEASSLSYIGLTRYVKGEFYKQHYDGQDGKMTSSGFRDAARLVTVLVYLNDVREGGETDFTFLNLSVKPKCGAALLFYPMTTDYKNDDRTLHESFEAVDEKWILTTWMWTGKRCVPGYEEHLTPQLSNDII